MIVFYELKGRDYEEIGRVADGEIISGRDELTGIVHEPFLNDEEELLDAHDGPHVLAERVEDTKKWIPYQDDEGRGWIRSDSEEVQYSDEPPGEIAKGFEEQAKGWTETDTLEKDWIPYQGPHGGEGWQNVQTGEVRYVEEPPGPVQGGAGGDPSPQRWGSWDEEEDDAPPGSPDDSADSPNEREEVTWDNVEAGDEISFYDDDGEMQEGEVTAVEQDEFGVVWVQQEEGGMKHSVEQDDFVGGVGELLEETVEAPDSISPDWMTENLFVGQTVKLHNKQTDSTEYGEIKSIDVTNDATIKKITATLDDGRSVSIAVEEHSWRNNDNDVFEIRAVEEWESLSREKQQKAIVDHFRENVRFSNIPAQTRGKVTDQASDEIFPSFEDMNAARQTAIGLRKISDSVSRANCGGINDYKINVTQHSPLSTLHHEFGHGVASAYGYHYETVDDATPYRGQKFRRRPTKTSHEYDELSDRNGIMNFDFREKSDWFSPESYMLRDTNGRIPPTQMEVGESIENHQDMVAGLDSVEPTRIEQIEDGVWEVKFAEYKLPVRMDENGKMLDEAYEIEEWDDYLEQTDGLYNDFEIRHETVEFEVDGETWRATVEGGSTDENGNATWGLTDGPYDSVEVTDDNGTIKLPTGEVGQIRGVRTRQSVSPDLQFHSPPAGFNEWKEEVEEDVAGIEYPDIEERDYTKPGEDQLAQDIISDLQAGDAVRFRVPSKDKETHHLVFQGEADDWNEPGDEEIAYLFEEPNGNEWHWKVESDTGELVTHHGSEITGYDDSRSAMDSSEVNVDNPFEHWDGFNPNPETTEEKMENLVSAVNKSWYRQAKKFERSSDLFENMSYYIGSGYSATNAHETLAMTHEVMQEGDTLAVTNLLDRHPSLVAAYVELFEPAEEAVKRIKEDDVSEKYGIEP